MKSMRWAATGLGLGVFSGFVGGLLRSWPAAGRVVLDPQPYSARVILPQPDPGTGTGTSEDQAPLSRSSLRKA